VLTERWEVVNNSTGVPTEELPGPSGGRQHLVRAEPETVRVEYEAKITAGTGSGVAVSPEQRIGALRPSRYCPSDRLGGFAMTRFGDLAMGVPRVRAICDYVWRHIAYQAETSDPTTDAVDTLLAGRGVCRDFAHLTAALCRALEVPARLASVYAPGLSPMNFHAVV
jgi:transglutaminase-like putative cysteine protease